MKSFVTWLANPQRKSDIRYVRFLFFWTALLVSMAYFVGGFFIWGWVDRDTWYRYMLFVGMYSCYKIPATLHHLSRV